MRKKAVFCVSLFLLIQVSISFTAAGTTRNLLYYPEDYEGKSLVLKGKDGGPNCEERACRRLLSAC